MKNCRFKPPNLPKKSPKPKNLSPESLQISKKLCTSCGTETRDLFSKIDRQVYNSKGKIDSKSVRKELRKIITGNMKKFI